MSEYNWRDHWQPQLRNGFTVEQLHQIDKLDNGQTLFGIVRSSERQFCLMWFPDGQYDDAESTCGLDLIPILKPKYRPFRPDERLQLLGRIVRHILSSSEAELNGYITASELYYTPLFGSVSAEKLLAEYVFADGREDDGQPVGVLE